MKHPGYVIGNHWLETAHARICAGEPEAEVLADYAETLALHGFRRCAVGQRTTQYCALAEDAVRAEREACAKLASDTVCATHLTGIKIYGTPAAAAIRERSKT